MARPLRIEYRGAVYHLTARGNRQADIYLDDDDREKFLRLLGQVCERYRWRCLAYCLMDNHYHLVIETPKANLSQGMRQLNGIYTQTFNRRHNRVGHVFQGRFKGIVMDKNSYLLEVARYVVLNPVRAGMTRSATQWRWSSYRPTTGQTASPVWLATDELLALFGRQRGRARQRYVAFIREGKHQPGPWAHLRNQVFLGDERFVKRLRRKYLGKQAVQGDISEVPQAQRRKPAKALAWYEGRYRDRKLAMAKAYLSGSYTLKAVGDYFGVHYTTVSRIVKNHERM